MDTAEQALRQTLAAHARRPFQTEPLASTTRYVLKRCGLISLSAGAGGEETVNGMSVRDLDKAMDQIDPPLDRVQRMAAKLDLRAAGILISA